MNKKEKIVVASGTFEILHLGHIKFLKEAKKLGKLIVIVARDENVKKFKNHYPIIPEKQRLEIIKSLKFVDKAILGDKEDIFKSIEKIKPDIIALGKNQNFNEDELLEELKKRNLNVQIVRINKFYRGKLNS
ncbi:MAG: adenylyltransferase/cytidyltransferase family protein, partial [Candidatus Altarchaeaceae archaeon]